MILNEGFAYKRLYKVSDLSKIEYLVRNVESIEFETFDDFVKYYLQYPDFLKCNITKLIVPITEAQQVKILFNLETKYFPRILFYLKSITKDIIKSFSESLENTSLLIDDENVIKFRDTFSQLKDNEKLNVINYLGSSYGYYRTTIKKKDIHNITQKLTNPFFAFPYFCIVESFWDYEDLQKCTFEDLRAISYHGKYMFNMLKMPRTGYITWSDFLKDKEKMTQYTPYTFDLMHPAGLHKLYVKDGNINISYNQEVPSIPIDKIVKGEWNPTREELNKIYGIYATDLTERREFVDLYQNYKINDSTFELPYMNKIINNLFFKGDI